MDCAHQFVSVPQTASCCHQRGAGTTRVGLPPPIRPKRINLWRAFCWKKSPIEEVFCFSVCYDGQVRTWKEIREGLRVFEYSGTEYSELESIRVIECLASHIVNSM